MGHAVPKTPADLGRAKEIEAALVQRAAAGDRHAQQNILLRLVEPVRSTLRFFLSGDAELQDVTQATLIEVLRSLGSFRQESRLETWTHRIAVRVALRHLRRRRRRDAWVTLEATPEVAAPPTPADLHASDPGVREELRRRLGRMVQTLRPERQVAVVLRLVHGYSIEEIATITATRVNTVRSRLRAALKQLRAVAHQDGYLMAWAGGHES